MRFETSTVVVTGAASGIGRSLAGRFAAAGARVALVDRDPDPLEAAVTELTRAGHRVEGFDVDVTDAAAMRRLEAAVADELGPTDILCNNAGTIRPGTAWDHTEEDWDTVLGVNLRGVVNGLRAFLPKMIDRGRRCHVVNTASVGGLLRAPGLVSYGASKSAVVSLTESLSAELAEGGHDHVGVSLLCPGGVATPFWRRAGEELDGRAPADPVAQHRFTAAADEGRTDQADPDRIADRVLDAIRHGRFWIVPVQPALHPVLHERHRAIEAAVARDSAGLYPAADHEPMG